MNNVIVWEINTTETSWGNDLIVQRSTSLGVFGFLHHSSDQWMKGTFLSANIKSLFLFTELFGVIPSNLDTTKSINFAPIWTKRFLINPWYHWATWSECTSTTHTTMPLSLSCHMLWYIDHFLFVFTSACIINTFSCFRSLTSLLSHQY